MKKLIIPIAIYTGTFVVLNVGMYFLLRMTQPKSEILSAVQSDSTASTHDDSLIVEQTHEANKPHAGTDSLGHDGAAVSSDSTSAHGTSIEAAATGNETALSKSGPNAGQSEAGTENAISAADDGHESGEDSADETAEEQDGEVVLTEAPKSTAEIAKLAKLLEGMKPDEAAVIAERLPTETIVQLVMRMKSRSGAKMMASLPVPIAASVATKMAELSGVKSPS